MFLQFTKLLESIEKVNDLLSKRVEDQKDEIKDLKSRLIESRDLKSQSAKANK